MAIAKATKAQRYAGYKNIKKLTIELQQYVQGLQAKQADAGYNTEVDALIDTTIAALTAIKTAA
ncbi:hypothetical protein phiGM223_55 [Pseudomonas phage phiGM22-3]|uniref:Uncharacterized protein n=1 Tax=Pseudomonas phage phiGM22-3 TaxID=2816462 RepID=A0A8T8IVA5_9CAUD|nr:hypothetical protein phiGM223_55 [Pseudomonas phage phiGM22-3]